MLHGLVPTLQPADPKAAGAASSSAQTLSRALPAQVSPDDLGKGLTGGNEADIANETGKLRPGDAKKKKVLLNKLEMKIKLTKEKLEELGVLEDEIKDSRALWLAFSF